VPLRNSSKFGASWFGSIIDKESRHLPPCKSKSKQGERKECVYVQAMEEEEDEDRGVS
jgi:hypothetical protein